jgi:hypothetical protein
MRAAVRKSELILYQDQEGVCKELLIARPNMGYQIACFDSTRYLEFSHPSGDTKIDGKTYIRLDKCTIRVAFVIPLNKEYFIQFTLTSPKTHVCNNPTVTTYF